MRSGRMMVEDPPDVLLSNFGVDTLEDVFLNICRTEGDLDAIGEIPGTVLSIDRMSIIKANPKVMFMSTKVGNVRQVLQAT